MTGWEVEPLTADAFAARVRGCDLRVFGAADAARLRALLFDRGVLVLPGQRVGGESLESFARLLGQVETVRPREHRLQGSEVVRLQSSRPGEGVSGGGHYWHADGSWLPKPTAGTVLACVVAPASGGGTRFLDGAGYRSWVAPELRSAVESAVGVHPNRSTLERELREMAIEDDAFVAAVADTRHPLVRRHPYTGRPALILNENWLTGLEGCTERDGRLLLRRLAGQADDSPYGYTHTWSPGDVLLWDNHRVLHRARPLPAGQTKVTWRMTLAQWSG
jgi:taurine dioxygenase